MTRKSRREIERIVDDLAGDRDDREGVGGSGIVYTTSDGGYVDADGDPVPTDDAGGPDVQTPDVGPVIVLQGEYAPDPSVVPDAALESTEGGDE